jgi:hypothetical protein
MAQTTRLHGDYKPLMNFDAPEYTVGAVNAVTSGAVVQPQGPKLDFFTITANAGMTTAQFHTTMQTIQQLATVHLYKYTDGADDTVAIAIYPTGAWTTGDLDTAITAATGLANVTVAGTATF